MLLLKEELTTIAAFVISLYLFPPESPCLDPPKPVERHFAKRSGEVRYSRKSEAMALGTGKP
jgi:hypothetical protein